MPKRRTKEEREAPLFWGITPNQLVGYNLFCARRQRGWTQAQAAEALEPHLGVRWTVAQVSAAERSVDGTRIRQFTADDIVAFAQAFEVPISYFFVPPRPGALWSKVKPSASPDSLNRTMAVMIDLICGDPNEGAVRLYSHLREVIDGLDPALMSEAQRQIFALARLRLLGVVSHAIGTIGGWQVALRSLAEELGELEGDVAEYLARAFPDVNKDDFVKLWQKDPPIGRGPGEGPSRAAPPSRGTGASAEALDGPGH